MFKIWRRYLTKEMLSVFFLFLFCFYGLYVLIDYTNHSSSFHHAQNRFNWVQLAFYYGSEFVHRSDVLIPFALLIATVRTLTKLNQNNELTALRAAGIPLSRLVQPFLLIGLLFTILSYASEQWLVPPSMSILKQIQDAHSSQKRKLHENLAAQHLVLKDDSTLIFQKYDTSSGFFFDAFWIRSPAEIYRIKQLNPHSNPPQGRHVDVLMRDATGNLVVVSSPKKHSFFNMSFNQKTLLETLTPLEDLPLSRLWEKWPLHGQITSDKEAQIVTAFYKKMAAPWLCFLAVIAPIPLCVRFSRQIPIFFLYAINIFGLVAVYLTLDSAQVLGKRQILDPALAIWGPFLFFFSIFAYRFCRMR